MPSGADQKPFKPSYHKNFSNVSTKKAGGGCRGWGGGTNEGNPLSVYHENELGATPPHPAHLNIISLLTSMKGACYRPYASYSPLSLMTLTYSSALDNMTA